MAQSMQALFKDGSIAFCLRTSGTMLSLLFSVLLARLLGSEGAGLYFLAATIVSVCTIFGRIGLDNSLLRFCAAAASSGDFETVRSLYRKGMGFACILTFIITSLIFFASPFIASTIFSEPLLATPLAILSLTILPTSLLYLHAELLKALRRIKSAMIVQGVAVPLVATLLLLLLAPPHGITGAVIGSAIASILVFFLSLHLWRSALPGGFTGAGAISSRTLLSTSTPLFVVGLMNIIIDFSDTVLIGYFMDSMSVGIYSITLRVTGLCSLVLTSVNSVVAPEFSSLWAANKKTDLQAIARSTTLTMATLACVLLSCFLLFPVQILSLFGSDFQSGKGSLIILAFGQFVALGTGPVAYLLMMTGHEKFHRNNVSISAGVNIILNLVLIPRYGIEGAAIATTIALSVKNIAAVLYVRSKLGIKVLL